MNSYQTYNVGIDDMAFYVPRLYLDIKNFSSNRGIDYLKLNRGLGLSQMAVPDVHEDAATMAANAVIKLIDQNQIHPSDIGRIYLGTESALDGAKPTATYVLQMLDMYYAKRYGVGCFTHCDVVDLVFACIGAVDALQNTIDWVNNQTGRKGIVVSSDYAKYDLNTTGEYTQGAGAVSMLITHNPRLMVIQDVWGVATESVHDFFKPRRRYKKEDIASILDVDKEKLNRVFGLEKEVFVFKDTPVFDGQYSNECYRKRIVQAFNHFKNQSNYSSTDVIIEEWEGIVFHLPYAFHGKRVFVDIFIRAFQSAGKWEQIEQCIGEREPLEHQFKDNESYKKAVLMWRKKIVKSSLYADFVEKKIVKGQYFSSQIGNMYTCSIFMSLMSWLEHSLDVSLGQGSKMGFISYGSGSKAKVFEGLIQPSWMEVVRRFKIAHLLNNRTSISFEQYELLHQLKLEESIGNKSNTFAKYVVEEQGIRHYEWID